MDEWSKVTGHPKGETVSPDQLFHLATRWYDDRLELVWRRKTVAERQAIFRQVGLTGPFWELDG